VRRKNARIWLLLTGLTLAAILVTAGWVYWAVRQVPSWYRAATANDDRQAQHEASDAMEQRIADLVSGLETTGRWEVVFTEAQVNGWLAYGLPTKHPDALPEGFTDPRVRIEPDGISGACRAERGAVSGVVSLVVDAYLAEPNVVAVRIRRARLGRLPWPLGKVLDGISQSACKAEVPLTWRQTAGDPVAIVHIPEVQGNRRVRIEVVRLGDGKLHLAGVTKRAKP